MRKAIAAEICRDEAELAELCDDFSVLEHEQDCEKEDDGISQETNGRSFLRIEEIERPALFAQWTAFEMT